MNVPLSMISTCTAVSEVMRRSKGAENTYDGYGRYHMIGVIGVITDRCDRYIIYHILDYVLC